MQNVSVIIKAFNEEAHIEASIRSALRGISNLGGEVILADSGSTDRTIEIARHFPITIVQLAEPRERCCGIGPQLGFQEVQSEFVYLLDGDMELVAGFLEMALVEFDRDRSLAGVGGIIEEIGDLNAEFRLRLLIGSSGRKPGPVSSLGCGGLYRTAEVRQVGYFSNRNLHSFEELELGVRLTHAGGKLIRIPQAAIRHHTHQTGGYSLLFRRWKSGYIFGSGECIRASLGKPYFRKVVPHFLFLYATAAWVVALGAVWFFPLSVPNRFLVSAVLFCLPVVLMMIRRKSFDLGMYSIVSWLVVLAGAVWGFVRPQVDPGSRVERRLVQQGEWIPECSRGKKKS